MTALYAPWTPEQVAHLNAYQQSGRMHPFTCGRRDEHPDDEGVLMATRDGWRCPADGCEYWQNWAHEFMARPLPPDRIYDALDKARAERRRGEEALRKLARIAQMAAAWEQRFPDTVRTAAVVEALRIVIQEQP